ncbi:putative phosphate acetyltransferase-like domain [Candidatus Fokinia solitaria]|uniref:Putative phosphate acetyltransferase-like domain n=1 Tax=Candidatus Fokinia solitaria TaxID=1802984 RepID=A0A2U8BRT2_9RICK|nr:bifunctional enoyl-CoA hydratase/phosphate acetyltransferase [Candidatus Fokinia solitaria]AWD33037.1 putative phosphate acetyltransferase-like domain [Candidatus Fokinia solitaria]
MPHDSKLLSIEKCKLGMQKIEEKLVDENDINILTHLFGDAKDWTFISPVTASYDSQISSVYVYLTFLQYIFSNIETKIFGASLNYKSTSFKWLQNVCGIKIGDKIKVEYTIQDIDNTTGEIKIETAGYVNNIAICNGTLVVTLPPRPIEKNIHNFPKLRLLEDKLGKGYEVMLERLSKIATKPMPSAIIFPTDYISLELAYEGKKDGIIEPILIGPKEKILDVAQSKQLDISDIEIMDAKTHEEAAAKGAFLAKEQRINCIIKGNIHTDDVLHAILEKENNLRTSRKVSHVFIMGTPNYRKPIFITDAVVNIAPDLNAKVDIVQNAVDLYITLFVRTPKVAILSAVETVNMKMQSTIDATILSKMSQRGQIKNAIVDGPLAFDNAISKEAAIIKGIKSDVAGDADIFVVPDIESGNILFKQMSFLSDAKSIGIVLGAKIPIVITSRAEGDVVSRKASCALAYLQYLSTTKAK